VPTSPYLPRSLPTTTCSTTNSGKAFTKQDVLESFRSGAIRYPSIVSTARKIRVFGNTAIVHGAESDEVESDGKRFSVRYVYLDVLRKHNGEWKLVGVAVGAARWSEGIFCRGTMSWLTKSPFGPWTKIPYNIWSNCSPRKAEKDGTPLTDSDRAILVKEKSDVEPVPEDLRQRAKETDRADVRRRTVG